MLFRSEEQLARLLAAKAQTDETPVKLIERLGFVDAAVLVSAVAKQYGLSTASESFWTEGLECGGSLSPRFLRERKVLPARFAGKGWVVAITDPEDLATLAELKVALAQTDFEMQIATGSQILGAIDRLRSGAKTEAPGRLDAAGQTSVGDRKSVG